MPSTLHPPPPPLPPAQARKGPAVPPPPTKTYSTNTLSPAASSFSLTQYAPSASVSYPSQDASQTKAAERKSYAYSVASSASRGQPQPRRSEDKGREGGRRRADSWGETDSVSDLSASDDEHSVPKRRPVKRDDYESDSSDDDGPMIPQNIDTRSKAASEWSFTSRPKDQHGLGGRQPAMPAPAPPPESVSDKRETMGTIAAYMASADQETNRDRHSMLSVGTVQTNGPIRFTMVSEQFPHNQQDDQAIEHLAAYPHPPVPPLPRGRPMHEDTESIATPMSPVVANEQHASDAAPQHRVESYVNFRDTLSTIRESPELKNLSIRSAQPQPKRQETGSSGLTHLSTAYTESEYQPKSRPRGSWSSTDTEDAGGQSPQFVRTSWNANNGVMKPPPFPQSQSSAPRKQSSLRSSHFPPASEAGSTAQYQYSIDERDQNYSKPAPHRNVAPSIAGTAAVREMLQERRGDFAPTEAGSPTQSEFNSNPSHPLPPMLLPPPPAARAPPPPAPPSAGQGFNSNRAQRQTMQSAMTSFTQDLPRNESLPQNRHTLAQPQPGLTQRTVAAPSLHEDEKASYPEGNIQQMPSMTQGRRMSDQVSFHRIPNRGWQKMVFWMVVGLVACAIINLVVLNFQLLTS